MSNYVVIEKRSPEFSSKAGVCKFVMLVAV
jgi:hypothetical protein